MSVSSCIWCIYLNVVYMSYTEGYKIKIKIKMQTSLMAAARKALQFTNVL